MLGYLPDLAEEMLCLHLKNYKYHLYNIQTLSAKIQILIVFEKTNHQINKRRDDDMGSNEFKNTILDELKDFYGKDARVYIVQDFPNNTGKGDGICIQFTGDESVPTISLNELYEFYLDGSLSMVDCIGWIIDEREKL